MKKTLFLAVLAGAALAGCVKNEEVVKSDTSPERITFDAPVVSVPTRATEIANNYPTDHDFGVFALYHVNDFTSYDACTPYMNNVQCTYNSAFSEDDKTYQCWAPVEDYYWPKTKNSKLTFGGYAPAKTASSSLATGVWRDATVAWGENGFTFTNFKVNDDPTQQIDLLYSGRVYNQTKADIAENVTPAESVAPTTYDGIQIPFKHALSSIVFTAHAEIANTIILTGIEVNNIYSIGTFNQNITFGTPNDTENPTWSDYDGLVTKYTIYDAPSATEVLTANADQPWTYNSDASANTSTGKRKSNLIVLPQNLSSTNRTDDAYTFASGATAALDATVTISYKIKTGDSWTPQQTVYNLATGDKDHATYTWNANTRYIYNITIGLDKIFFALTVTDFDDGDTVLIEPSNL